MIWQGIALAKAKDEDTAIAILALSLGAYIGYKLVFKSRVDALLEQLEGTLLEGQQNEWSTENNR